MVVYLCNKTQQAMTLTITNAIYENFRKFEVEFATNGSDMNLATIKENGKEIMSFFANSEKSMKAKVTKWIKANW